MSILLSYRGFKIKKLVLLLFSILFASLSSIIVSADFVTVNETQFYINDTPFYFAGANNYYLFYMPWSNVVEVLNDAAAMNLTVMRTWGFCDGSCSDADYKPFQSSPGVYEESTFQRLDLIIKEASDRNLRLIIPFVNNWNTFGGMCQYVKWCNIPDADSCNASADGGIGAQSHDAFYTSECTKNYYKRYIAYFLNRTNAITGIKYKDDPTILAWQLGNEIRARSDTSGITLTNWINEMAAYVKSQDNNHLLGTGEDGFYKNKDTGWQFNGTDGQDYLGNLQNPNIDFAGFHNYIWSTFDNSLTWLEDHIREAHALGKPVVITEFGEWPDQRDDHMNQWYNIMETNDANGDLFWHLTHDSWVDTDNLAIYYPSDVSTVNLIMVHAAQMKKKNTLNQRPVVEQIANQTVFVDDNVLIEVNAYDPDGDELFYSIDDPHFTKVNNTFLWTPNSNEVGVYPLTVSVSDYVFTTTVEFFIYVRNSGTCVVPSSGSSYNIDTNLCPGTYNLNSGISITGNNVDLDCQGSWLIGSGDGIGISLIGILGSEIRNCIITHFNEGIMLDNSPSNTIKNNDITDNKVRNLLIKWGSTGNTIIGNDLSKTDSGEGLTLWGGANGNIIIKNNIIQHHKGVYDSGSGNVFSYNNIFSNVYHIYNGASATITVENNYWGTTSQSTIGTKMYGLVDYIPFLTFATDLCLIDYDCNDYVSCTADSCNSVTGVCNNMPIDSFCDNGLWCDGAETCDVIDDCQSGVQIDCSDSIDCTADICNETIDVCQNPNLYENTACGSIRFCPDNSCNGFFEESYSADSHDYCDGFGNCIVYNCQVQDSFCSDDDLSDGIGSVQCGAECDADDDCDDGNLFTIDSCFDCSCVNEQALGCTVPYDNMTITNNTLFCQGSYFLPNGIIIQNDSVVIDCNHSLLYGNNSKRGIQTEDYGHITVANCELSNFGTAISLVNSGNNIFLNNQVHDNMASGLDFFYSYLNTVENNEVYNNGASGILFFRSGANKVINNRVYNNTKLFEGCGIKANDRFSNYDISRNIIYDNQNGICINGVAENNNITNNIIYNHEIGIIVSGDYNLINDNNIFNNQEGIYIAGISNTIWGNNFTNNNISAMESSTYAFYHNNWNKSNTGNLWSDFENNNGYPNVYYILGTETGLDWWPVGRNVENCTIPKSGMNITKDTVFCKGIYDLTNIINITANNIILDCNYTRLNFLTADNGIHIKYQNNVKVMNCIIYEGRPGIDVENSKEIIIENNNITGSLHFLANNSRLSNNYVSLSASMGAPISVSGHNLIIENNIVDNWAALGDHNIYLKGVYNSSILYNDLTSGSSWGRRLSMDTVENLTIKGNIISGTYGIFCWYHCFDLIITENNFIGCNTSITDEGNEGEPYYERVNIYNNNFVDNDEDVNNSILLSLNSFSLASQGNYWSTYDEPSEGCYDQNNDGMCDSPYLLSQDNQDEYPYTKEDGWNMNGSFVTVNGTNFYLGDDPFYFAGTNSYFLWYGSFDCNKTNPHPYGECVTELMDDAVALNFTVIRTWGFGETYKKGYQFQTDAGVYDEKTFAHFDRVIKEASDRNLKLLITLANNWEAFGGMCTYVNWCVENASVCDSDADGNTLAAELHDQFYTNECTKDLYKRYVNYFLNRTNTLTGIKYKDDPTILGWELANEPRARSDPSGDTLNNWIAEMSAYIKSIDDNHLVASGEDGFYITGNRQEYGYHGKDGADFIRNSDISTIDFCSFHAYDWWGVEENMLYWIQKHAEDARYIIGKPIVAGETDGGKSDIVLGNVYHQLENSKVNGDLLWFLCPTNFYDPEHKCLYYPSDTFVGFLINHSNYQNNKEVSSNNAPIIEYIDDIIVDEGESVLINVVASDLEDDELYYSIDSSWFIQDDTTFEWKTNDYSSGTYYFRVVVHDQDLGDSQLVKVVVLGESQDCILPADNMLISSDTVFCPGEYHIPNGMSIGSGATLKCMGTVLKGLEPAKGISIKSDSVTIRDCTFTNYYNSIFSQYYHHNSKIINNTIMNNPSVGIWLELSNNNLVESNTLDGCSIKQYHGVNNVYRNNKIFDFSYPCIIFHDTSYSWLINNSISDCRQGVVLHWGSKYNVVENNHIFNNTDEGISFEHSANDNIFKGNDLSGNKYGIRTTYGTS
ncbi:MAG: NosD domain-containing protein, partial [Nanoarchaeota archaeon]